MGRRGIARAGTGLAVGALLTAPLLGVLALGTLVGIPVVPYTVFEWLVRVLPGRVVTLGLDSTLWMLEGLGLDISRTAKTAQQILGLASLFVAGLVVGLLFFLLVRTTDDARIKRYGLAVGAALGLFSLVVTWPRAFPRALPGRQASWFGSWLSSFSGDGAWRVCIWSPFLPPGVVPVVALEAPRARRPWAAVRRAEAGATAPTPPLVPSVGDASSSR